MSRPSLTTGEILINTRGQNATSKPSEREGSAPMHIAMIGDFSGRGSRGESDTRSLATRKVIEIDRDNFDEVFSALKVELALPVADETIAFSEFDDLHPDTLFEHVSLFGKFRGLKRKLKNPALFQQAADEIMQWSSQKPAQGPDQSAQERRPTEGAVPLPDNMLDALLSQKTSSDSNAIGDVDLLIRDIVAPYIESKSDPRLPEFESAVDDAIGQAMRKIMHSGAFQELEANWRAVYFLIRRLETNKKLKLFLIDVSRDEIVDELINCESLEDTGVYKRLVESYQTPGAQAFSILQFNYPVEDDIDDLRIAAAMAQMAADTQGLAIAGASEKLAGCSSLHEYEDVDEWRYPLEDHIVQAWEQIRNAPSAQHLALVAPRFLMRMPYGKKSSPIDTFRFEELGDSSAHEYYCWGSGATAVTLLLAESYLQSGWDFRAGELHEIDNLPLHIYQDDDESVAKACAEIFMRDSVANAFGEAGLLSLRSIKGRAGILVPRFRSVAKTGAAVFS